MSEPNSVEKKLTAIKEEISTLLIKVANLRKERNALQALLQVKAPKKLIDPSIRGTQAIQMRGKGMTYAAISKELGCSVERARQIIANEYRRQQKAKLNPDGIVLSVRTANCLQNHYGVCLSKDKPDPKIIFRAENDIIELLRTPNFGKRSAREVIGIAEAYRRKAQAASTEASA